MARLEKLAWIVAVVVPVALLAVVGCKSDGEEKQTTDVSQEKGVPGGTAVATSSVTATVTAIDKVSRHVSLVTADGNKTTVKVGPSAANFDQIELGDKVKVTVTQELVVALAEPGQASADGRAAAVVLAPIGAKPGGIAAATVQATATVTAIDISNHKATLQFADGTTKTFLVRKDVDLTKRKVGEKITFTYTESVAILVEKP
jgi:hypothetical protein